MSALFAYCECGCGGITALATQTDRKRGYVKGEPMRFKAGHGGHEKLRKPLDSLYVPTDMGHSTPCWIWQGGTTSNGYGRTKYEGRMQPAHRALYLRAGKPFEEGQQIDHLCRVPLCVNPDHLEAVTALENVRRSRSTKLTLTQVTEIREIHAAALEASGPVERSNLPRRRVRGGLRLREELAAEYGVTADQIKHIWGGRSWAA